MTFKDYCQRVRLITEAIQKSDIIDLYIVLAMPKIDDPAYQFVADDIVDQTSKRILDECENVILQEFAYALTQYDGVIFYDGMAKPFLQRILEVQKNPEAEKMERSPSIGIYRSAVDIENDQALANKVLKFGRLMSLPELSERTIDQWSNTGIQVQTAIKELRKAYRSNYSDDRDWESEPPWPKEKPEEIEARYKWKVEQRSKRKKYETTIDEVNQLFDIHLSLPAISFIFADYEHWEEEYGGPPWALCADEVQKLKDKNRNSEAFLGQLDRLVDFVHNNGPLMTKFKGYSEGWFKFILDIKHSQVNIKELFPYASSAIKPLIKTQEWQFALHGGIKVSGTGPAGSYSVWGGTLRHTPGSEEERRGLEDIVRKTLTHHFHSEQVFQLVKNSPANLGQLVSSVYQKASSEERPVIKAKLREYLTNHTWSHNKLPHEFPDLAKSNKNKELYYKFLVIHYGVPTTNYPVSYVNSYLDFLREAVKIAGTTGSGYLDPFLRTYDYTKLEHGNPVEVRTEPPPLQRIRLPQSKLPTLTGTIGEPTPA